MTIKDNRCFRTGSNTSGWETSQWMDTQTVINTSTLSVEDNIIELNRNISSNAGMPNYTGLKVNRGELSQPLNRILYWVWDETFADDGTTTVYGNAGGAWTAFKSGGTDENCQHPHWWTSGPT
jgi:hypothetical protein